MRTTGRRRGGRTVGGMVKRMAVVLVAAAALAMPGIARAHGGHTHTIRGTITERSDARVSIKQTDGKVVVVTLNAKTALTRGDKKVDAAALEVGQRVIADVGDGKTPLVAKSVKLGVAK